MWRKRVWRLTCFKTRSVVVLWSKTHRLKNGPTTSTSTSSTKILKVFPWAQQNVPKLFGWCVLAPVLAYFSFVTDIDPHNESFLTWSAPHTHLAWSVFLFSGAVRGLHRLCAGCAVSGCLGLGSDLVPWELLPQCELGRVQVFHGWPNTEEHSGLPVSQREKLTHNEACFVYMGFIVIQIVPSRWEWPRLNAESSVWRTRALSQTFIWLFPQSLSLSVFLVKLCSVVLFLFTVLDHLKHF